MSFRMRPRNWMLGLGASALLLVGGVAAASPLADLNEQEDPLPPTAPGLSIEDALRIATDEHPDGTPLDLEFENEGRLVYGVEFSDDFEIEIDANTGEVIETEPADEGEGNDMAEALRVPELSLTEAQEIAVDEGGDADVMSVDLEFENDRLVYSVELSNGTEVELDADTGDVLETEQDDDDDDDDDVDDDNE